MSLLRVSLEQWQAFVAVVKEGGYANASQKLNKSQPTLSYLVKKIEDTLNVALFTLSGRKSELTPAGKKLYYYAIKLIGLAYEVEFQASENNTQVESKIRIAVDEIYPLPLLMAALSEFATLELHTRIIVTRGILSGPADKLQTKEADIAITFKCPHDVISEHLITLTSAPFAAINHPLHQLNRSINESDLIAERQIILMDSNQKQGIDIGFLSKTNAWYVDTLEMKLQMLEYGLGYAWINEQFVANRKTSIKPLPFDRNTVRHHSLYIAYRNSPLPLGPSSQLLIQLLKAQSLKFAPQR